MSETHNSPTDSPNDSQEPSGPLASHKLSVLLPKYKVSAVDAEDMQKLAEWKTQIDSLKQEVKRDLSEGKISPALTAVFGNREFGELIKDPQFENDLTCYAIARFLTTKRTPEGALKLKKLNRLLGRKLASGVKKLGLT